MEAIIICEDGIISTVEFDADGDTLSFLQASVGGYVEHLPFPVPGVDAWINEEGKFTCESNDIATQVMRDMIFPGDWIAGPMVLTGSDDEGETVGLTATQVASIMAL